MRNQGVDELFRARGTLYQKIEEEYEPLGDLGEFSISIVHREAPERPLQYEIQVYHGSRVELTNQIDESMALAFSDSTASVLWDVIIDGKVEQLAFRFHPPHGATAPEAAALRMGAFVEVFNRCTYSRFTNTEIVDTDDEWFEYLRGLATTRVPAEESAKNEPVYTFALSNQSQQDTGKGNVCLAESVQYQRALVVQKGKGAKELSLQAHHITENGFGDKQTVTVGQVDNSATGALLCDAERKMLLFGNESRKLHEIDLERATVVSVFNPDDFDVRGVTYANQTPGANSSIFTCLAPNVAFNVDTRLDPRRCVVTETGKSLSDYAIASTGKKHFTCHATSTAGHLAIGDSLGNIRLYSGPPGSPKDGKGFHPKSAKTLLETKIPIVDIDLTADGKYLVAACAKFLLFIDTTYTNGDDVESGFVKRMGRSKPEPVRLQLSLQQAREIGGVDAINFTTVKFDRFHRSGEECITACCGPVMVVWSMRDVLRSLALGRSAVCSTAPTQQAAKATSAGLPSFITYITNDQLGTLKLTERSASVPSGWSWRS